MGAELICRCTYVAKDPDDLAAHVRYNHDRYWSTETGRGSLVLTPEEVRALVDYMRDQYVNRNLQPVLSQMLDRLDAHVQVTA